jgi:aromatic amino acid permease
LERESPERLALKVWLFPWLSILTFVGMICVLIAMARSPQLQSQFYASLVCAVVVAAARVIKMRIEVRQANAARSFVPTAHM